MVPRPALTCLVESWSNWRTMQGGRTVLTNGVVQRVVHLVQGIIRTIQRKEGEDVGILHSIWPWFAQHAGFLLSRFEVGQDEKKACERLKGKSAKT